MQKGKRKRALSIVQRRQQPVVQNGLDLFCGFFQDLLLPFCGIREMALLSSVNRNVLVIDPIMWTRAVSAVGRELQGVLEPRLEAMIACRLGWCHPICTTKWCQEEFFFAVAASGCLMNQKCVCCGWACGGIFLRPMDFCRVCYRASCHSCGVQPSCPKCDATECATCGRKAVLKCKVGHDSCNCGKSCTCCASRCCTDYGEDSSKDD